MKKLIVLVFCLMMGVAVAYYFPKRTATLTEADFMNRKSIIPQKVEAYQMAETSVNKLYYAGRLVGVISDVDYFNELITKENIQYLDDFPGCTIGLKEDLYIVEEKTFDHFENIDDQIVDYLKEKELLGIKTTEVQFSDDNGVYAIIYVKSAEDFYAARDSFVRNFVSEKTMETLSNGEGIDPITDFGTIESGVYIRETMTVSEAITSPANIMKDEEEIYQFLCYGTDDSRQYYTVQEGESLAGVGYHNGDFSVEQLYNLNRDVLTSADQILTPGMVLNVTYFKSPITVVVTKQRLVQENITPPSPEYRTNDSMEAGKTNILQDELVGLKNVLYEETWINGVLRKGDIISSVTVREPVRGVIEVGTMPANTTGSGNFIWPTDSPIITCHYGCYFGHTGTDIANRYNRYGNVVAADSGVVEKVSYDGISGHYIIINHNNGLKTYYGHMYSPAYFNVGESVNRGQIIGQIGMTGWATGPHIHFQIYVNETIVNVCSVMDCSSIS